MKLLMLGGTMFMGRHLVGYALEKGHEVTIFTRGRHNPTLFPEAEKLLGDRDGNLSALEGRRWDAVIDTCGYVPRVVRDSARLLRDAADHYTFISSISVYADFKRSGIDEDSPVARLPDPAIETVDGETYGGLKALCEEVVREEFGERAAIVRPGLIVGPFDPTDRFTWWPVRVTRGGETIAPDRPDWNTQIIDARDLAAWTLRIAEARASGTFNATGPDRPLPFGEVLEESLRISGSDAVFTWVPGPFLVEAGVQPWSELPLWVPESEDMAGFSAIDIRRALAEGLTFRSLAETIRDTLLWHADRPADHAWKAGLAPEKEAEVLKKWRERGM